MPDYEQYRQLLADASAEQKLAFLHPEARRLLTEAFRGAIRVRSFLGEHTISQLPSDIGDWCNKIVASTEEMIGILEMVLASNMLFPEQKLQYLRQETVRCLSTANGYARLLLDSVEKLENSQISSDFEDWCKQIFDNTREVRDLVQALTDSKHRDILRREREEEERKRNEGFWEEEQAEFSDLQNYTNFIEAVEQTAVRMGFSIPVDIKISSYYYPAATMSHFSTPQRRVNIQTVTSSHKENPKGYFVTLSELAADELSAKGRTHEGITRSLNEVVEVLYHWLMDNWDFQQIGNKYEWMRRGKIRWY
jgi:hypothetical protein